MEETRPEPTSAERPETAPAASAATWGDFSSAKVKEVFRRLGPVGPLAIIASSLPLIGAITLLGLTGSLTPWLQHHGGLGVGLYIAGFALLAGLALLPTHVQAAVGGFAFGTATGSFGALAGVLGASMIGYIIARRASGDRVVALINEQPKWRAVYDSLIGGSSLKTLGIVFLLRVPTSSPFAITNLVLAITRVNPLVYAIGTVVGMAPRTIAAVVIGAGLSTWDTSQTGAKWLLAAGIVATIIVFSIIGMIANHAVQRVTGRDARPRP